MAILSGVISDYQDIQILWFIDMKMNSQSLKIHQQLCPEVRLLS